MFRLLESIKQNKSPQRNDRFRKLGKVLPNKFRNKLQPKTEGLIGSTKNSNFPRTSTFQPTLFKYQNISSKEDLGEFK